MSVSLKSALYTVLFGACLNQATVAKTSNALSVDRSINIELSFPNDDNIQPNKSDFKVVNYVIMSSESGERWAVVTLKNLASGKRIFDNSQLLGLFADGSRNSPLEFKQSFDANETLSLNLFFGHSQFPLLQLYTYN